MPRKRTPPSDRLSGAPRADTVPGTRDRILRVAHQLIVARGDAAISLVEVAAVADVSRQTMYVQFGSRAGLLLAMVEQIDADSAIPARMMTARTSLPPEKAFEPYLRVWFEYLPVVFPIARALSAAATSGDEDAAAALRNRMDGLRDGFLLMTRSLAAAGQLRKDWTPERAAEWMYAMTHIDQWQHLVVESGWAPGAAIDRIIAALGETLISPSRLSPAPR